MPLYNPISNSDLIAIKDENENFVATNVEDALAESAEKITTLTETVEGIETLLAAL